MKNIATCLWFDQQAEAAADFYAKVFERSKKLGLSRYGESGAAVSGQKAGSVMTVDFQLENLEIQALNGGPMFKFTPALSFFVTCDSRAEIDAKWEMLSQGGQPRMALDNYPWAERYGWTADRFGVEWQLIYRPGAPASGKISPAFLFVDKLFGKGEEAIRDYVSIFPNSKIEQIAHEEKTGTVMFCSFSLNGQSFALMDGPGEHGYGFTEATSLVVTCEDQREIDFYWDRLLAGGSPQQCGWLKDKYGVSWQIVPADLSRLMSDPQKAERVMAAMLKMVKLDHAALMAAAR